MGSIPISPLMVWLFCASFYYVFISYDCGFLLFATSSVSLRLKRHP